MVIKNFIKALQDITRKDAGINGDAQRIEQIVWLLFLKIFDIKESEWEAREENYKEIIPSKYRWKNWAANEKGITGKELLEFIEELFIVLKSIEISEEATRRRILVKEFFQDTHNYMKSGSLLRKVINVINKINFEDDKERHSFNDIYEIILKDLQSAGNAGEYYTPRPVTDFIVDILKPQLGEKIADFACGTGGFLISALEYIKQNQEKKLTKEKLEILGKSIYGIEKKPLPYSLCLTNMIIHNLDTPNIKHGNGLTQNIEEFKENELVDVIAMNPPFGGNEEETVKENFPNKFRTSETADLFFTRMMYQLKDSGRCGVVLPDGFLFGEGPKTAIKKKLLKDFNLEVIVRLPNGVFSPYTGITTNLIFFSKPKKKKSTKWQTKEVWFFEHPLPKSYKIYSKTKPIKHKEFDLERKWWTNKEENENAWKVNIDEIIKANFNLDFKNPNKQEEELKSPDFYLKIVKENSEEINKIKEDLKDSLEVLLR
ncbi:MAG: SAM-dependent methyltransferase [Fusobacteriales bacterium]|nr:MAG: SAM-dependent methyltransferase [Fusobacteriales bacterium]